MTRNCALHFSTPPSPRALNPRILTARKPGRVPSWLSLQCGQPGDEVCFALLDSQGEKRHPAGSLSRAA